jgi:hypothetical protein
LWYGINGYTATSPPNFVPVLIPPLGETGPPIVFTKIGQTVRVIVSELSTAYAVPTVVSVACNSTVGTLTISNATSGRPSGSADVTLSKSTGGDPLCNVGVQGDYGNFPGTGTALTVSGP